MNIFIIARILGLFFVDNSKSKSHILTKVAFTKPVSAFLKPVQAFL